MREMPAVMDEHGRTGEEELDRTEKFVGSLPLRQHLFDKALFAQVVAMQKAVATEIAGVQHVSLFLDLYRAGDKRFCQYFGFDGNAFAERNSLLRLTATGQ